MTKGINESVDGTSAKYNIEATFVVQGVVEVQDVVGALFGQTEGLLNDLELRELQKSGRIGRIVVNATSENGVTKGDIIIPSSLDRIETAILAATLETVDRVGPCRASLHLNGIRDLRESKLKQIETRAKELLKDWRSGVADSEGLTEKINTELEKDAVITWKGLPAGSEVETADHIIIVEGRNDIQQLFKIGVKNTVAVNGTSVPKAIIDLTHEKECTAFLDGDRGGDMILNELLQVSKIKFYARAPLNREVEELTPKELVSALQQKKSVDQLIKERKTKEEIQTSETDLISAKSTFATKGGNSFYSERESHGRGSRERAPRGASYEKGKAGRSEGGKERGRGSRSPRRETQKEVIFPSPNVFPREKIKPIIEQLISSNEAIGLDGDFNEIYRSSNVEIFNNLDNKFSTIILDGVVTQRFVDKAMEKGIKRIIAVNIAPNLNVVNPTQIELYYFKDFFS